MMGKRKMLLISAGGQIPWRLLSLGTLNLRAGKIREIQTVIWRKKFYCLFLFLRNFRFIFLFAEFFGINRRHKQLSLLIKDLKYFYPTH